MSSSGGSSERGDGLELGLSLSKIGRGVADLLLSGSDAAVCASDQRVSSKLRPLRGDDSLILQLPSIDILLPCLE